MDIEINKYIQIVVQNNYRCNQKIKLIMTMQYEIITTDSKSINTYCIVMYCIALYGTKAISQSTRHMKS